MAKPQRQAAIQKEDRIELALQAYQQNQFSTPTTTAKAHDVPQKTLQQCIDGIQPKLDSIMKNHLLTSIEEDCLLQWILSMNKCDMPSRIAIVCEMVHILVTQQQQSTVQLQ